MDNAPRRGKIDPIWWAPVLFLVIAALSTLTALQFNGTLRKSVPLTLVSDRAGLVMENGAKVKLRGVQVGEVASIGAESAAGTDSSKLNLRMDPGPFQNLPSNVEAEIKSSTASAPSTSISSSPQKVRAPSPSSRALCCTRAT